MTSSNFKTRRQRGVTIQSISLTAPETRVHLHYDFFEDEERILTYATVQSPS